MSDSVTGKMINRDIQKTLSAKALNYNIFMVNKNIGRH